MGGSRDGATWPQNHTAEPKMWVAVGREHLGPALSSADIVIALFNNLTDLYVENVFSILKVDESCLVNQRAGEICLVNYILLSLPLVWKAGSGISNNTRSIGRWMAYLSLSTVAHKIWGDSM